MLSAQPEVHVKGNGYDIFDGAGTWPDSTGQAFGVLQANVDSVSNTYWIYNTGTSDLTLSNFRVTAVYNTHFNIFPPSNLVVAPGDSVFYTVQYKPTAAGTHGRTTGGSGVCVAAFDCDDADEAIYEFRISGAATADPSFDCSTGRMFFSHLGGGTDLKEWNYSEQPPTLSIISNALTWNHDGMGMNPNDNYIYTMRYNNGSRHQLWALSSTGVATFCGYVSGGGIGSNMGAHASGGAMDSNNNLYTFHNADATTSLKRINVRSQQAEEITLSSPVHARAAIYNPTDGLLYAMSYGGTNDGLVSVDPTNGNVTLIGGDGDVSHAAMFRSSDGTVYMMTQTYTMYTVDLTTGAITQVAANPGWGNGTWVDGCACGDISLEADLAITKTDNRPSYVPGALNRYTITVTNLGPHGAYQATVQDLVPTGITPANMSWYSTTYGTATSTTTSGTGDLNDVIDLGVGDSIVYTVRIIVDNGFTGNLTNTATVTAPSFLTDPNAANNTATDINVPTTSATEQCNNGFDDDGDGLVDCFDGDCAGNSVCASHFTNGVIPACPDTPDVALFSMKEQYRRSNVVSNGYATPIVGDLDGDGLPEVVVNTTNSISGGSFVGTNATIRVLNGQTGAIKHARTGSRIHYFSHSAAIADVDNDGDGEIFMVHGDQRIRAYDHTLTLIPGFTTTFIGQGGDADWQLQKAAGVQFADFDQDGQTEIFVGNQVFNALTGAILAEAPTKANVNNWPKGQHQNGDYMPAAADVLPDNFCPNCSGLEIIAGNTVYAIDLSNPTANAALTVAAEMAPTGTYTDGFTSIADWDGDDSLDVIVTTFQGGASRVYIWNPRTQALITQDQLGNPMPAGLTTVVSGRECGRASIADFDGDGINELTIVSRNVLKLYESDLSLKWERNVDDPSSLTSATAFDFEGDGNVEVVYRDEEYLRILDGVTGVTKDSLACTSGTRVEMPVIADVDADGQAEIAVACGNDVVVYEADQTPWMPTRKVWNTLSYSPVWINDDLTIPAHRQNKATVPRNDIYAAQAFITDPSGNIVFPAKPDFVVTIDSSTVGSCNDDSTAIHVTICNDDAPSLVYDYPLSFYDGDPNSGGTLLGTRWVTLANTTFTRDSCYYFTFNAANQPTDLYVMVNDSGTGTFGFPTTHIEECDSTNNQANADVGCAIDAGITKDDGQLSYIPGGPVTYTIIAKNNGPNFTGGVVSDPLPAGVNSGDVTWTATTHGGATTTAVGTMNGALQDTVDIPGGDSITYLVTIATPASLVGDLVNVVTITVSGDTILTNNTATDTDTVDCTFAISGTVNSRTAGWTEIGTVRSGNTYTFGTGGGFKSFTATNGPENGQVVNTVVYNTGTGNQVSLTRNRYNSGNSWFNTISTYDNTPHGWTGLSGTAPENAPILGFMAFIDQNGNGQFDSGVEEYIRDLTTLSLTPTTTGQLYMAFYDDGFYNDNSGILTLNASVTPGTVSIGNDTTLCSGNTITLDAGNPGATYTWSTGASSQTIVANSTGEYSVAVNTGGGCVVRDTIDVTVDTVSLSLGNDTAFCAGDSITLDAGNPGATYLWSTGATSQTITVNAAGQYFVAVTNGNNCVGRDTMNVTSIFSLPVVDLGNDTAICAGTSLTVDAGNAGSTFLWSNTGTSQTINVSTVGEYSVRVTDGFGCIGRDTMEITAINNNPTVSLANDTAICAGTSITLDAGNPGATYLWSDGSSNPTLAVSAAGQYFVAVTDGNGCIGRDTMNITAINANPTVNLGNDTTICAGTSVTWDAGNLGSTFLWNDGSTGQTLVGSTVGQYFVAVTDPLGCVGRDTAEITGFSAALAVDLGSDTSICANDSLVLDAGNPGSTYVWNDLSTGQTLTVNTAGTYFVEVTSAGGCVGRDTMTLSPVNPLPIVDLGPSPTTICAGSTLILDAGNPGATYLWQDGSGNQTFGATSTGTYHVLVTLPTGCSARDTMIISGTAITLDVDLGNDTSICQGSTYQLNAQNTGSTFTWHDGSTNQTFDVNSAGQYYVTVQDPSGCTGSDTIDIGINPPPIVDLVFDFSLCSDAPGEILNQGSPTAIPPAMSWYTGPGITGNNVFNAQIAGAGLHSITYHYVDANGCEDSASAGLNVNGLPSVDLGPDIVFCENTDTLLDAGPGGRFYQWSDGSTGQTLSITTPGTYDVQVFDNNGCLGRDTIVTATIPAPTVDLGPDGSICSGTSLTLDAGNVGSNFLWSDGSTAQTTSINTLGEHWVEVTGGNGCSTSDTFELLSFHTLPVVDLGNDQTICTGSSLTLDAGNPGATYIWQDGSTNQTFNAATIAQYYVEVRDGNGCVNSDTMNITGFSSDIPVALGNDTNICSNAPLTLNAGSPGSNYLWNDGSTSQTLIVSSAGTYDVLVSGAGGCNGRDTIVINNVFDPPSVDIGGDQNICQGTTLTLDAGNAGLNHLWSDGSTNQTLMINSAGEYSVTVTDGNGCIRRDTMELLGFTPLPSVSLGNDTAICTGTSLTLNAGNAGATFVWNDGSTAQTLAVNSAAVYFVEVTVAGCSARDSLEITAINSLPSVSVNDINACPGVGSETFTATAPTAVSYLWSGRGTGTNPTTTGNTAGTYTVTVVDANGCENTASGTYTALSNPSVSLADQSICGPGETATFTAVAPTATSFVWSDNGTGTGSTTSGSTLGTYTVTVDDGSCSASASATLSLYTAPTVDLGDDFNICDGQAVSLSVPPYPVIQWSTGQTSEDITVGSSATIIVTITDNNNCTASDTVNALAVNGTTFTPLMDDTVICEASLEEILLGIPEQNLTVTWQDSTVSNTYIATSEGEYIATIVDTNGCIQRDTVVLTTFCERIDITMPNVFTPDGTGINDYFIPIEMEWADKDLVNANVTDVRFEIWNRWGLLMYGTDDYLPRWDGRAPNGYPASDGTYFWILSYTNYEGERIVQNGFVRLLNPGK